MGNNNKNRLTDLYTHIEKTVWKYMWISGREATADMCQPLKQRTTQ